MIAYEAEGLSHRDDRVNNNFFPYKTLLPKVYIKTRILSNQKHALLKMRDNRNICWF